MKQFIYILCCCLGLSLTQLAKGQTAAADNKVSESITFSEPPKGPSIYGIFEGRTPYFQILRQSGADSPAAGTLPADYDHLKWQLILYRDSVTLRPTTYTLTTELFARQPLKGTWRIIRGTRVDPSALVYALDYGQPAQSIYLLKGDENVLFILDKDREFRTGNLDFSYTLNRVIKVRHALPAR